MKKWIALFLAVLLTLSLAACGGSSGTPAATNAPAGADSKAGSETAAPAQTAAPTEAPEATPTPIAEPTAEPTAAPTAAPTAEPTAAPTEPPAAGKTVTVTIPADLVGDLDPEEVDTATEEDGVLEVTVNEDGSVTYVMTQEKHEELMQELAEAIDESIAQILEEEETAAIFKKIEHDKDYSSFKLYVDQEAMTGFESFYALVFCMAGANYQAYAGKDSSNVPAELIDAATGEVIDTVTFDDYLEIFSGLFGGGDEEWDWGDMEWENESNYALPEIEPTVLLDQDGVVVTATGFVPDLFGNALQLEIVNNGEKTVTVSCENFMVNNYSCPAGLYSDVPAGETVEDALYLPSELDKAAVEYIGLLEIQLSIRDEETYETLAVGEPVTIRTSDYGEDWAAAPEGETVYDENGLRIIYLGLIPEEYWGEVYDLQFLFYFENNSGKEITVESEVFTINGLEANLWLYTTLPAGTRALDSDYVYPEDLGDYGIEAMETAEVQFGVYDGDTYEELFKTDLMVFDLGMG